MGDSHLTLGHHRGGHQTFFQEGGWGLLRENHAGPGLGRVGPGLGRAAPGSGRAVPGLGWARHGSRPSRAWAGPGQPWAEPSPGQAGPGQARLGPGPGQAGPRPLWFDCLRTCPLRRAVVWAHLRFTKFGQTAESFVTSGLASQNDHFAQE